MRRYVLAMLSCLLLAGAMASPSQARLGLTIGFNSQDVFTGGTPSSRALWLGRAAAAGAKLVRLNVNWSSVAPAHRPAGFAPADPASPGYDWTAVDAEVRTLSTDGLRVLMTILSAPGWAEGPDRPAGAALGTWRPDPAQFAAFATAAAKRYGGHFPDPANPGSPLPTVRYWQPWNEPNLPNYLTPQWAPSARGFTDASAVIYRQLLNAFYAVVKAESRSNFVVTAGTAPYGDPRGGNRVPPAEFDRDLFCLKDNRRLTPLACPDPPHLDALSHHPYGVGGPLWHAQNPDDVAVPDIYKLARVLKAAQRWHHVLPRGRKQFWDTEVSWDSNPPDPGGVPIDRQARWVEQTLHVLWSQGVDTVLWLQIVDSPPGPSYGVTSQGGIYFLSGQPKPAAQALRFPFVTRRLTRRRLQAWGRAPQAGTLRIEVRRRGRWKTVRRLAVRERQVFVAALAVRGRVALRANLDGERSLVWTQSR